jgi:hypothetical protein
VPAVGRRGRRRGVGDAVERRGVDLGLGEGLESTMGGDDQRAEHLRIGVGVDRSSTEVPR